MERKKFKYYEQRPCKFIFRNGKQVFGVIWEDLKTNTSNYYFASTGEFKKRFAEKNSQNVGFPIQLDDLIHAELLT